MTFVLLLLLLPASTRMTPRSTFKPGSMRGHPRHLPLRRLARHNGRPRESSDEDGPKHHRISPSQASDVDGPKHPHISPSQGSDVDSPNHPHISPSQTSDVNGPKHPHVSPSQASDIAKSSVMVNPALVT